MSCDEIDDAASTLTSFSDTFLSEHGEDAFNALKTSIDPKALETLNMLEAEIDTIENLSPPSTS